MMKTFEFEQKRHMRMYGIMKKLNILKSLPQFH